MCLGTLREAVKTQRAVEINISPVTLTAFLPLSVWGYDKNQVLYPTVAKVLTLASTETEHRQLFRDGSQARLCQGRHRVQGDPLQLPLEAGSQSMFPRDSVQWTLHEITINWHYIISNRVSELTLLSFVDFKQLDSEREEWTDHGLGWEQRMWQKHHGPAAAEVLRSTRRKCKWHYYTTFF